ncbi:MAG: hypothetical protein F4Z77_06095 [Dehalococcoidia bacterium]|nr:hypothetical protein [Dehalococcoidia bacterium]MYA52110.1 hypothetical protein [Dehalococcoidia bacterium]
MAQGQSQGPVFGRLVSFKEAFPDVELAEFRYTEWPVEHPNSDDGRRYRRNPGEFIRCGNPRCRNEWGSGLPAGRILREMVESRAMTLQTSAICEGVERGRHARRCLLHFEDIRVSVRYRPTE